MGTIGQGKISAGISKRKKRGGLSDGRRIRLTEDTSIGIPDPLRTDYMAMKEDDNA